MLTKTPVIIVFPANSLFIFSDFTQLAAASSNHTVALYDLNIGKGSTQFGTTSELKTPTTTQICGIRYAPKSSHTLYVSTSNEIHVYDVRTKAGPVQQFHGDGSLPKAFTCFDVNSNGKVICAGTEQTAGEANLLFFDVRANTVLATYTDSHRDDVTQVKYHPTKRNYVATGSTDGLINIFDTKEADEDDALENCLNTESSIQTIAWHSMAADDSEQRDYLACVTDTNDFQLFDVENCDLEFKCERADVTAAMRRKVAGDCYLVNSHATSDGQIFCLAGSNYNNGECLRSLRVRNKELVPLHNFIDNKQIVRCSLFNSKVWCIIFYFLFGSPEGESVKVRHFHRIFAFCIGKCLGDGWRKWHNYIVGA